MARYEFTFACGHPGWATLAGSHSSRQWRLARFEEELCRDCFVADRLARSRADGDAAVARVAADGAALAQLVGTPKQVAWAEQIRAKALVALDEEREEEARDAEQVVSRFTPRLGGWSTWRRAVTEATDAAWWCDRGRASPRTAARAALACAIARDPQLWGGLLGWEFAEGLFEVALHRLEAGDPMRPDQIFRRVEDFARQLWDAASSTQGRRDPPELRTVELRAILWVATRNRLLLRLSEVGADYAEGRWGVGHPENLPAPREGV